MVASFPEMAIYHTEQQCGGLRRTAGDGVGRSPLRNQWFARLAAGGRWIRLPVPGDRASVLGVLPSSAGYRKPQPAKTEYGIGCVQWLAEQNRTS
jgi:hypothetical protein